MKPLYVLRASLVLNQRLQTPIYGQAGTLSGQRAADGSGGQGEW